MTVFPPLLKRKRIVGFKLETTPGTAVSLSGSDAVANCWDVEIQNETESEERDGQGSFSPLADVPGADYGTAKFKTEMIGDDETLPWWMLVVMPACGWVASSLAIAPQSNAPGIGGVKCGTLGVWEDGLFKSLCGAMGNPVFTFLAGKRVIIEFSFKGIWVPPVDAALPTPTYVTTPPLQFKNSGLSIGGA